METLKIIRIERALINRLYREEDLEKKMLIFREIADRAKRRIRAMQDIAKGPNTSAQCCPK
jgi:hypothetical protein